MNRLQFLFFLILCPILAHSQTTIIKGANRIVVEDSLLQERNYTLVAKALLDHGYEIDKTEKELGTITTAPQHLKKLNGSYYFYIVVADHRITIIGKTAQNGDIRVGLVTVKSSFQPIQNIGMKGSIMKESFNAMNDFATKLNFPVSYEKTPL